MTPLIYISALRRTGSTVLSESLTQFPDSFIFREPRLGSGTFRIKENDAALFMKQGIDLYAFSRKWSTNALMQRLLTKNRLVEAFEADLMPKLLLIYKQIGVKEIHHNGWQYYADAFPKVRCVLTARDPRDIFISTYYRVQDGKDQFRRGFSARELARDLNRDFRLQLEMVARWPVLNVRYEDLCADPGMIEQVKTFVGSSLEGHGDVGQFNSSNPLRSAEANLHGGTITDARVQRWAREKNRDLVSEAGKMLLLMPEYVEFWGYEP